MLLDFWTAGCINCLHVQPLLRRLETAFADVLVVIGVHTPKYPHEATLHSVQQAVARYGIRHPVVNDPHWQLWQAYRVPGWPTLVVIDPEGRILQGFVGENHDQRLERLIAATVAYHRRKGTLRPGAAPAVALPPPAATALRYPGKVLADAASSRLFIADSGHHRLVVTDLEGRLLAVVGSGQPGAEDGPSGHRHLSRPTRSGAGRRGALRGRHRQSLAAPR
ncbi:MAG: hypothetical protein KatS3mg131_1890 [Candidatus Tectimicrobiota bacterium]|nr:MAG: hypothetical protein KatS3mg131_1890 [Candidatus Tectomicrobia bacterium]